MKFLSRLLIALNLLPSIATLAFRQQAHLSAKYDELRTNLAYRSPVILAEIRNRLVVGDEPPQQPHDLGVASGLTLKPTARLNAIEIAVNVKLQQFRWMIGRPAGRFGSNPIEPQSGEVQFINEGIDAANRIVLIDPVLQVYRK